MTNFQLDGARAHDESKKLDGVHACPAACGTDFGKYFDTPNGAAKTYARYDGAANWEVNALEKVAGDSHNAVDDSKKAKADALKEAVNLAYPSGSLDEPSEVRTLTCGRCRNFEEQFSVRIKNALPSSLVPVICPNRTPPTASEACTTATFTCSDAAILKNLKDTLTKKKDALSEVGSASDWQLTMKELGMSDKETDVLGEYTSPAAGVEPACSD